MASAKAKQFMGNVESTIKEFINKIMKGYGFIAPVKDTPIPLELEFEREKYDYTSHDNFLCCSYIVFDVDDSATDMKTFIRTLPRDFHPTLAYPTESNRPDEGKFRFRLMYFFDQPFQSISEYMAYYMGLAKTLRLGKSNDLCMKNGIQTVFGNPLLNVNDIYKHRNLKIYKRSDIQAYMLTASEQKTLTDKVQEAENKRKTKVDKALKERNVEVLLPTELCSNTVLPEQLKVEFWQYLKSRPLTTAHISKLVERYRQYWGDKVIKDCADFSDGIPVLPKIRNYHSIHD